MHISFSHRQPRSIGDDLDLYADDEHTKKLSTFYFLRQQIQKPAGQFNHCLADFVAPQSEDYLGGFAVSIHGADELAEEFKRELDDYSAIMTKALADRLAEAFAEYLHKQTRIAWGFGREEQFSQADLIRRNIAASDRCRITPPVPITQRSERCSICWLPRTTRTLH
jgi:5-methyltetrahydrofolate--homocysteine methyltransferase